MKSPQRPSTIDRIFGFPALLGVLLAVIVFFCVPRSMADPDIWWHLRNAEFLTSTHTFITHDMYSFTAASAHWMNHEWLAELPFYFGWRLAGAHGVYWVTVLAVELIMLGIFVLGYRKSRNIEAALLAAVVAALLSTVSYGPRTLLFGWMFLLLELFLLQESTRRPAVIWYFPLLFAVWVNTHGSWMIGLVVFAIYIAAGAFRFQLGALASDGLSPQRLRTLLQSAALSIAALFLNPYGWRLVAYPFNLAFHQKLNVANVEEWRSLDFHSPRGLVMLALLAMLVVSQLWRSRSWKAYEVAFVFLGLYAGLNYSRFLFLFSILALPILAKSFPVPPKDENAPVKPLLNAAIIFVLLCFAAGRLRNPDTAGKKAMQQYPVAALPYLQTFHPRGPVFNEYLWGGFMIWRLRTIPVFIDSRVDIFEYNGTFKDYLDIIHIKDTEALLAKYGIRYVLYEKDTPLVYLLQHTGGWKVDYEDTTVILLERLPQ